MRKFYHSELDKLKTYFDDNLDFYRYYRTGNTCLDKKYFLRGKHDIRLTLDSFYFQADHRFTTSHDFKVAQIMANDLIQVYLEGEIHKLEKEYEEYAKFCEEDDKDFWQDWEKASVEDLDRSCVNE